jgi:biotin carboxyl carrier protein
MTVTETTLTIDGIPYEVMIRGELVTVDGKPFAVHVADDGVHLTHKTYSVEISGGIAIVDGVTHRLEWKLSRTPAAIAQQDSAPSPTTEGTVTAIMPGTIVDLRVREGDTVNKGDVVVILEAMKMGNELKAPQSGTVCAVRVQAGDDVEQHQVLVEIE